MCLLSRIHINLDAWGMCASTLCMIHCLAFPLVVAAMALLRDGAEKPAAANRLSPAEADCCANHAGDATLSSTSAAVPCEHCAREALAGTTDSASYSCCSSPFDFRVHLGLLTLVVPLGMVAWIVGYRRHKAAGILWLGLAGLGLLVSALLIGHHLWDGRGEQVMTVAGSMCMVSAHLWNRRRCRCCRWPRIDEAVALTPEREAVA